MPKTTSKTDAAVDFSALGTVTSAVFPGGRLKVKSLRCINYKAKRGTRPPAPTFVMEAKDAAGGAQTILWGMGQDAQKRFQILAGGLAFKPVKADDGLGGGTKGGMLMAALHNLGLKPLLLKKGLAVLDGAVIDTKSQPYNLSDDFKKEHKDAKDSTVLIPTKIVALAGETVPKPLVETDGGDAEDEGEEVDGADEGGEGAEEEPEEEAGDDDETTEEEDDSDGTEDDDAEEEGDSESESEGGDDETSEVDLAEWVKGKLAAESKGKEIKAKTALTVLLTDAGAELDATAIDAIAAMIDDEGALSAIGWTRTKKADDKGKTAVFLVPKRGKK